jgi:D-amino-acid dehydrogenase
VSATLTGSTGATPQRTATVIGAGIVGVCCALYLQRAGFAVTLFDRGPPGEGCSAGNAGGLGTASCVPAAMPGVLARVPRMLFDPASPLILRWRALPGMLPWLARFVLQARSARVEAAADARASLQRLLFEAYDPLLERAGARHLVRRDGLLLTFESEAGFRAATHALDLRRERGIAVRIVDGGAAREIEPALSGGVIRGAFLPDYGHTIDPLGLTRAFAAAFAAGGGRFVRANVRDIEIGPEGPRALLTDDGAHPVDLLVLAAGAWSRPLAARLGVTVPLAAERGYHVMLDDAGSPLRVPVNSPERSIAVVPMAAGVRASGISEFAGADDPPDFALAERVRRHAVALLPGLGGLVASRWMGPRPSLPDSRPIIGRAPRFARALLAFGHDHVGLGTAAITGRLIGELATGERPTVDLTPFRPDRF